ncbi:NYN domain-containing protein [Burkholderia sp. WAC0059]|uniref:NYN domain-containing protein n=1 Tax=Burkholderia sp. WAC0059 TaxID=2066022 RepID=UPI000C7F438A|nr:NYN domain-containing protein [Burkholderia sp. WAC0059]PLZ04360.1 NYN domain-containing protein [Burkholderia sp. WAC0059]
MASPQENVSMAVFCDFENVALGVRDAKIDRFDIKPVLERLLLKGNIVVKKAYCDWERYKGFKSSMHEASFELIEIPHVRQSGKNSADIRLVVDALDLCYTKSHVDTFVIVSGDSDFSPLVSKLRENDKKVIGVGVKNSTSDLLVANCDEFIFYDDLVREQRRAETKREAAAAPAKRQGQAGDERQPKPEQDERRSKAIALAVETLDALVSERGESGKIWASVLKSAIKRRRPDFSESRYGFRAFGNLLDEAQARGLLEVGRDEKSGAYVSRPTSSHSQAGATAGAAAPSADAPTGDAPNAHADDTRGRRRGRRDTRPTAGANVAEAGTEVERGNRPSKAAAPEASSRDGDVAADAPRETHETAPVEAVQEESAVPAERASAPRRTRKPAARGRGKREAAESADSAADAAASAPSATTAPSAPELAQAAAPQPAPAARKTSRSRRPRSKAAESESQE